MSVWTHGVEELGEQSKITKNVNGFRRKILKLLSYPLESPPLSIIYPADINNSVEPLHGSKLTAGTQALA